MKPAFSNSVKIVIVSVIIYIFISNSVKIVIIYLLENITFIPNLVKYQLYVVGIKQK